MSVEITIQGNKREAHPRGPIQPDPSGPRSLHPKGPRSVGQRPLPRKRHGPHGSHRAPAEIFFSASFSLPPKKLPFPALIFDGQLKTRHAPGTSFEPYPIPVLADPKKDHPSPRPTPGSQNLRERRRRLDHHRSSAP